MSDDTDISMDTDSIQESIGSAVDSDEIKSMLDEETPDAAGRELGSRIGREVGSRIGQELGLVVARDIQERKSIRTILRNAGRRLIEILKELLRSIDLKSKVPRVLDVGRSVVSGESATGVVESILPGDEAGNGAASDTSDTEAEEATEEGTSTVEEATEKAQSATEEATEKAESVAEDAKEKAGVGEGEEASEGEEGEEASEGEEADSDGESLTGADLSADEMRELKEETYKELLEAMSYRDLQSLAKDIGVKANLAQGEMTDRIVAEFSEEGEA